MKIKFLKDTSVDELKQNISNNIENYKKQTSEWISEENFIEFKHDFPEFELNKSFNDSRDSDFENIKIIYLNMRGITESQASDERLWSGLCHKKFWKYMQYRWSLNNSDEKDQIRILNRYFFGKSHPLFNNALSKLWWIGHFTYDESSENPFELTEYALKDFYGRSYSLFAVQFSYNKRITRIFLKTLMEFEKQRELTREEWNNTKKMMVLWGGKISLDALTEEQLKEKLKNYLKKTYN